MLTRNDSTCVLLWANNAESILAHTLLADTPQETQLADCGWRRVDRLLEELPKGGLILWTQRSTMAI